MKLSNESSTFIEQKDEEPECKIYRKRWWMLTIFSLFAFCNIINDFEYDSITDAVIKHYNISHEDANWTSLIMILVFMPAFLPATYFMYKLGLRKSMLCALIGTSVANWIKLIGVAPNKFWIILFGQAVISMCQAFVVPLCAQISAVWFGENEVSTACNIGILVITMANALGCLIPPLIVNSANSYLIGRGLYLMSLGYALFPTFLIFIAYFWFLERPSKPPTMAQLKIQNCAFETPTYLQSIKALCKNVSFLCLNISHGITFGMFCTFGILLNQITLMHYPDATTDVGIIGFLLNAAGALGSLTTGIFLDKFRNYRTAIWILNILCIATSIALYFSIKNGIYFLYLFSFLYGFLYNAIFTVSMELGIELTYPISENISVGFLIVTPQIFTLSFTYLHSYLLGSFSEIVKNVILCCIQVVAACLIFFVKFDLKRQKALKN